MKKAATFFVGSLFCGLKEKGCNPKIRSLFPNEQKNYYFLTTFLYP